MSADPDCGCRAHGRLQDAGIRLRVLAVTAAADPTVPRWCSRRIAQIAGQFVPEYRPDIEVCGPEAAAFNEASSTA